MQLSATRLSAGAGSGMTLEQRALAVIRSLGGDVIHVQPGYQRLWTDSAGTTPVTAVGDVIGRVVGRTGLITATQAATANKPVVGRGIFNQLSRSHKFDDAAWSAFSPAFTRTLDSGTGPNGLDCYKITATATVGVPFRVVAATAATVTFAVVAKTGTYTTLNFLVRNSTTATTLVGTNTSVSLGNGWNLHSLVCASGISVGDQLTLYHGAAGTVTSGLWWLLYASGLFIGSYSAQQIIDLGGIPETGATGGWSAAGRLAMSFDGVNVGTGLHPSPPITFPAPANSPLGRVATGAESMCYTSSLTITVPAALYGVACAIARALDPDVGGAESFGPRTRMDDDGAEYTPDTYTTTTPCVPEFAAQALAMASNPAMLHYAVSADYATRWPDLTPPTLDECHAFCAGAVITTTESNQQP